ncbi:peptidase inhibitor family I36 protein [Virgisporangium aurantiacum]|nr:peptidase inhibitor family I36 protein [Virgisporangium aurantiacum]
MRKYAALLAVPTLVSVGVVVADGAAAYGGPTSSVGTAAAWDCPTKAICFWDSFGGVGQRCYWSGDDSDWLGGSTTCPWAGEKPVKSVRNNGEDEDFTGVAFYRNTGYGDRIGCTRRGQQGNLQGDYKVRSHRWITTTCG